jgi:hypothetical protein
MTGGGFRKRRRWMVSYAITDSRDRQRPERSSHGGDNARNPRIEPQSEADGDCAPQGYRSQSQYCEQMQIGLQIEMSCLSGLCSAAAQLLMTQVSRRGLPYFFGIVSAGHSYRRWHRAWPYRRVLL